MLIRTGEHSLTTVKDPKHIFYSGVPEPLASDTAASLQAHSVLSFREGGGLPGFADAAYDGRRAFVRTTRDACFPLDYQDANIKGSGVEWSITSMATCHCPFLSAPKELAGHRIGLAERWA